MLIDKTAISERELRRLIDKYSGSTPRYTSYPTAVEFHQGVKSPQWQEALDKELNSAAKTNKASLYVHVPFCHSLCYYCACNKIIAKDDSGVNSYLDAVSKELTRYAVQINNKNTIELSQLHWGGGTPNFLSVSASKKLFDICTNNFARFSDDADISIEIDPRTITLEHLSTYRELGFNRLSAGVQDFNYQVQEAINRIQSYEDTARTCQQARDLGFNSLNLDLIYGLPKQTELTFKDTIEKVLSIRPDRIALYGYAHVTWKNKTQKSLQKHDLPSPETRINLFLTALNALTSAGYVYIGMDHFALPEDSLTTAMRLGNLNRNFMGYSTHKDTSIIGVGVSSISSIPGMLAQNTTEIDSYLQAVEIGFATHRGIQCSLEDKLRAEIIEAILCNGRVIFSEFNRNWEIDFCSKFADALIRLEDMQLDSLVKLSENEIIVEPLGRLFMRNIASVFDAYLEKHLASDMKRFSQSV